ncbi:histone chaperone domain CHZ-domain-containing protein [Xylariales sp. PMI_506]|nr:histone chaperone domain CHZ-domain-containing protein [Xylariales sp. PMI_506]
MSAANGSAHPEDPTAVTETKGKGKAAAEPVDQSMEEDDESSEDEAVDADAGDDDDDDEEDDNMDEIDLNNIVASGRRTRGKVINWAEAAKDLPPDEDEDDEDDEFHGEGEVEVDEMDED